MRAKGYCRQHYQQWKRKGDPTYRTPIKICSVPNCEKKNHSKELCSTHYSQVRKNGKIGSKLITYCSIIDCINKVHWTARLPLCKIHAKYAYSIKKTYGLSWKEYQFFLEKQRGVCGICGGSLTYPHVDHNHLTNEIRG